MESLDTPNSRDIRIFKEWMERPSIGSVYLIGRDRDTWTNGDDLIALKGREKENKLASWLIDTLTPICHYTFGKYYRKPNTQTTTFAPNIIHYSNSTLYRLSAFIGTILASLLPISAIIVLYFITRLSVRLGLVEAFTAFFSICL